MVRNSANASSAVHHCCAIRMPIAWSITVLDASAFSSCVVTWS
jgi:hypothetical protein